MSDIRKSGQRLIAEIDETEVAAIIAEACIGVRRPEGTTAQYVLDQCAKHMPENAGDFQRAARRVMLYLQNQMAKGTIAS